MARRFIGFGVAVLFLIVAYAFTRGDSGNSGQQAAGTARQQEQQEVLPAQLSRPAASYNPISIPALAERPLQGSDLKLGKVLADNAQYTRHYITYQSGNLTISGIMNVPKGTPPEGGFPLLVLNHGYIDPSIYTNGRGLKREQDYLAKQGFAVLHPDYRNHAESDKDPQAEINIRLGYIEDVLNAVDAAKKSDLAFINKDRIGMLGHSMGGGITLGVLVTKPDLIKAAVLFAPVSGNAQDSYYRWTERRPDVARKITELFGSPEQNPDFWKDVSPASFYGNIRAPVDIHHGTKDADVPLEWSQNTLNSLKASGKTATLYTYEGQPHEFTTAWTQVMERTAAFFRQNL